MIFTANDRLHVFVRALELEMFKTHERARVAAAEYEKQVIPRRNDLGHRKLVPKNKPQAVIDNEGNEIGLDEMRALRCVILNLRNEFSELLAALRTNS
jgi:hypothetical protein